MFVSRSLNDTEKCYSQMEREFLAITFGMTKLRNFLFGIHFHLMTDHKPIVQLFDKPIDTLSNKLQRWLVSIQHFSFTVSNIKGTDNVLADALLHNSISGQPDEAENVEYTRCDIKETRLSK